MHSVDQILTDRCFLWNVNPKARLIVNMVTINLTTPKNAMQGVRLKIIMPPKTAPRNENFGPLKVYGHRNLKARQPSESGYNSFTYAIIISEKAYKRVSCTTNDLHAILFH